MKTIIFAGPPTSGKTTVIKQCIKRLLIKKYTLAFLKIDVQYAEEDIEIAQEFNIPVKKVYSGEICPDHVNVLILDEAIEWANNLKADILFVETAGLCLRCSPYIVDSLGISVIESTSGINLPKKIGPILSLSDIAIVTKIDLISQAEREVFRSRLQNTAKHVKILEVNALYGIGIDPLLQAIKDSKDIIFPLELSLRGNPPVGTCTICIGKKNIGRKNHCGILRTLDSELFYQGE